MAKAEQIDGSIHETCPLVCEIVSCSYGRISEDNRSVNIMIKCRPHLNDINSRSIFWRKKASIQRSVNTINALYLP